MRIHLAVRAAPPTSPRRRRSLIRDAVGWLRYTRLPYTVAFVAILIGLGHSVLAMSGEETMAQVYREIEHPKLKNLEKAGFVIFVYSLIFTAGTAFFVVMIIPDAVRSTFFDNPIGGLAALVVPRPTLASVLSPRRTLCCRRLTRPIVGSTCSSTASLRRIRHWFRHPHRRFVTSHVLNLSSACTS